MSLESYFSRLNVDKKSELKAKRKQIIEETTEKELLEIKLKHIDEQIAELDGKNK